MGPFVQVKQGIKVTSKVYLGLTCKNASHHDSHENLCLGPNFWPNPFWKNQGNSNFTFVQNSTWNAASFEFLSLSPKPML
jgi:hypothetical protein